MLGSASLASSDASDPVDNITDEQVAEHLQKFPSDSRFQGRSLRAMVQYQRTHPQFRKSRVVEVTSAPAPALMTVVLTRQGSKDGEQENSVVTQEEMDAHLERYPEDKWLSRSLLELVVTRAKQLHQEREMTKRQETQRVRSERKTQREQNRRVQAAMDVFCARGVGAEPPSKRPFNWELERQKQHKQHIREKDEKRKRDGAKGQLKRKCEQQVELEEHVYKTIRQEEQQEETNETVDNGLSQIGSLADVASTSVDESEPSSVFSPVFAPVVVLSSTGTPSEQVGDGATSDGEDGGAQPVLRLRGGAPEESDDDEGAFDETSQSAHPVSEIGASSGEVHVTQVQQATTVVTSSTPVHPALTVGEVAAVSLVEIEGTAAVTPQEDTWLLVGSTWMQHANLVRRVEAWWSSKVAPRVDLEIGRASCRERVC